MSVRTLLPFLALALPLAAGAADANRLAYLDDPSPFWPRPDSPRLTTPQWIGEPGVEAAVVLAIDDMREPEKYEAYLRPILDRLKRIDGRAPVSIMTNAVDPSDPRLQEWLGEGLSLEVHTLAHPCPCLGKMSLADAAATYHGGVDLLASVPGNRPVAFRMPCCDSMNSASPRFFSEIFPNRSPRGNALAIDSSVFTLPPGGRFAKYFPSRFRPPMKKPLGEYAAYVEDYPFPYVVNRVCWEFPCVVPSDWESFNIQGPEAAEMLEDWKAALGRVVEQRGVFTAVFHPHGWSGAEQWVAFIDHAEATFGKRVKFLNFREALERIEKNALGGASLRDGKGTRLADLDGDGFLDVVQSGATRVWRPSEGNWRETPGPALAEDAARGVAWGVDPESGAAMAAAGGEVWVFREGAWRVEPSLSQGLAAAGRFQFRDFDQDGRTELLGDGGIRSWQGAGKGWGASDLALPGGCAPFDAGGRDNGLRFADLDGDGCDDVVQSNDAGYSVHLWTGAAGAEGGGKRGWTRLAAKGGAGLDAKVLPFVKEGRNYGAWFRGDAIVWQNEDVATPGGMESVRRTFREIVAPGAP